MTRRYRELPVDSGRGTYLLVSTMQPIVQMALSKILLRDRIESNVSCSGSNIGIYLS